MNGEIMGRMNGKSQFFFFFLLSDNKGYDDAHSHGEWIGISHAKKRQIR